MIKRLKKNVEIKSITYGDEYDNYYNTLTRTQTNLIDTMFRVTKGDARDQRDGTNIIWRSIAVRWRFALDSAETNGGTISFRIALIFDREPLLSTTVGSPTNGEIFAVPSAADTPYGTNAGLLPIQATYQWENAASRGRFQFLYDQVFTLPTVSNQIAGKFFIKRSMRTVYELGVTSDTGNPTYLQKGHLFFMVWATKDNRQPLANNPTLQIATHAKFTDL